MGGSAVAVLNSQTYKAIEWHLYRYHELRREAVDLRAEREALLNPGRTPASPGGGGVSRRSDPTATNTLSRMRLGDRQAEAALWVKAIEHVIARYEEDSKGTLLDLQYFSDMAEDYICEKLSIDRATYFRWRTEVVIYTALVATQYRLIKVT